MLINREFVFSAWLIPYDGYSSQRLQSSVSFFPTFVAWLNTLVPYIEDIVLCKLYYKFDYYCLYSFYLFFVGVFFLSGMKLVKMKAIMYVKLSLD